MTGSAGFLSMITAFIGGILSSLSPCVLPLVPGYLSYLAGTQMDMVLSEGEGGEIRKRLLKAAFGFVLGFSTVFIALGAVATTISLYMRLYQEILSLLAGGIIILFSLHMMGVFKLFLLYREARFNLPDAIRHSPLGSYCLGMAFGFGWTPCIGPVLAGILTLAAAQETVIGGIILLAFYAAGLGIPFLGAAWCMNRFVQFSKNMRSRMIWFERGAGMLLFLTGIAIIMGKLSQIGSFLIDFFPFLARFG